MKRAVFPLGLVAILFSLSGGACAGIKLPPNADKSCVIVEMKTTEGTMLLQLSNETPQHRDNFVKLVDDGYYKGLAFHRVIKGFMIQGGDPDTRDFKPGKQYGTGGPNYTVPAEIKPELFHKKGALAAARQGDQVNPEKRSSGSQFYIVQGEVIPADQIAQFAQQMDQRMKMQYAQKAVNDFYRANPERFDGLDEQQGRALIDSIVQQVLPTAPSYTLTPEKQQAYTTVGGTPHLDNEYTVFGEVIAGLEVIDAIGAVETDQADCPKKAVLIEDIRVVNRPK